MSLLRGCGAWPSAASYWNSSMLAAVAEPVEPDLADHGARVHAELLEHPVVVSSERFAPSV